jgi:hypothetical protein
VAGANHLPPGREPGRLSRSEGRILVVFTWAVPGLAAAGLWVATIATLVSALWIGAAIMGGLALFMTACVWFIVRASTERQTGDLAIDLVHEEVRRGTAVAATVRVLRPDRLLSGLEIGLVCTEFFVDDGAEGPERSSATAYEQWFAVDPRVARQSLALSVPSAGPFSYEGTALALAWAVAARKPGATRTLRRAPVWVTP